MCNGLKNPKSVPMKKVDSKIKVLNFYIKKFPKPEHTTFSSGEMINVVIGMIPNL